jgi:hypothetical protein
MFRRLLQTSSEVTTFTKVFFFFICQTCHLQCLSRFVNLLRTEYTAGTASILASRTQLTDPGPSIQELKLCHAS